MRTSTSRTVVAQAISADAADLAVADVRRRVLAGGATLTRLSPELARAVSDNGPRRHGGAAADMVERGEMLEAIMGWLVGSASRTPVLLVVEDLHWSTTSTRDLLRHLVRAAGRDRLLVVATARDTATDLDEGLSTLLADLERSPARVGSGCRSRSGRGCRPRSREPVTPRRSSPTPVATRSSSRTCWRTADADRLTRCSPVATSCSTARPVMSSTSQRRLGRGSTPTCWPEARERRCRPCSPSGARQVGRTDRCPARSRWSVGFVHALFRSHRYEALPLRRRLELHARAASALAPGQAMP